jgi:hypothetical protein
MGKSPLDIFFGLGDKATGGDPKRKADFDYYMLWIIFFAFVTVFVSNLYSFIKTLNLASLGWAVVVFGVLWFQYYTLKSVREGRVLMKKMDYVKVSDKKESVKDMIKGFDNGD